MVDIFALPRTISWFIVSHAESVATALTEQPLESSSSIKRIPIIAPLAPVIPIICMEFSFMQQEYRGDFGCQGIDFCWKKRKDNFL